MNIGNLAGILLYKLFCQPPQMSTFCDSWCNHLGKTAKFQMVDADNRDLRSLAIWVNFEGLISRIVNTCKHQRFYVQPFGSKSKTTKIQIVLPRK